MNMRVLHRSRGFTLIEVLIALAIFAVGALGILTMVSTSMSLNLSARQFQEANYIAQWKTEQLQTLPIGDAQITACTSPSTPCRVRGSDLGRVTTTTGASVTMLDLNNPGAYVTGARYQVLWWNGDQTGLTYPSGRPVDGLKYLTVEVRWPRDKEKQSLGPDQTGGVDCFASPAECRKYVLYSYRKN